MIMHSARKEESLDGGVSKTLHSKIFPSIIIKQLILGCLTSDTKKFTVTLNLIQM